jgi:hypothetical protein
MHYFNKTNGGTHGFPDLDLSPELSNLLREYTALPGKPKVDQDTLFGDQNLSPFIGKINVALKIRLPGKQSHVNYIRHSKVSTVHAEYAKRHKGNYDGVTTSSTLVELARRMKHDGQTALNYKRLLLDDDGVCRDGLGNVGELRTVKRKKAAAPPEPLPAPAKKKKARVVVVPPAAAATAEAPAPAKKGRSRPRAEAAV